MYFYCSFSVVTKKKQGIAQVDVAPVDVQKNSRSFNDHLKSQPIFFNPYSLEYMTSYYGIHDNITGPSVGSDYPLSHFYDKLRDFQNCQWARETYVPNVCVWRGDWEREGVSERG